MSDASAVGGLVVLAEEVPVAVLAEEILVTTSNETLNEEVKKCIPYVLK
jgi:hypothetical protein